MTRLNNAIHKTAKWTSQNLRSVSIIAGSVIFSAWTMLRFFTKTTNFDLVGQQVLSHQWLTGIHGSAVIGPTNYILKMLLLYMPFDIIPISQRGKLIVMTLLVNIATYVLILILLEKIWKLFYSRVPKAFYIMMLWFASVAGAVFWIQFSNSRNLEVVGGLLLAYLLLRIKNHVSAYSLALLVVVSGILFFADPLQIYMTAVPLSLYLIISTLLVRNIETIVKVGKLLLALAVGFLVSRFIVLAVEKIFKPIFLVVPNQRTHSIFITIIDSALPFLKQAIRMYSGGYELGRFTEAANVLFVSIIILVGIWYLWKKLVSRRLSLLIALVWAVDAAVYVVSGQALQGDTSRYLIMTVPFFVLFGAMVLSARHTLKKSLMWALCLVVTLNIFSLSVALAMDWNPHFSKDSHINAAALFMKSHNFAFGYASIDAALPANYFSAGKANLLPLQCKPGGVIKPAYLFFDKAYYTHTRAIEQAEVPFILDGSQIANYPNNCSKESIRKQLGDWNSEQTLPDGSTVLIYDAQQMQIALFK